jgi:HD-like signal output (HDOD) protein
MNMPYINPNLSQVRQSLVEELQIPPHPQVLQSIHAIIAEPDFDLNQLAQAIGSDPGVTASLFRVVGSVAYRKYGEFHSILHILQTIGVRQATNLVSAIALVGQERNAHLRCREVYETFWNRSQAIAQLAMIIADERVTVCNIFPDQAYLAGIFHDCGVPVLMQRFPDYCEQMGLTQGRWVKLEEENRLFDADHCVVGYLVARHWKLPDYICEAIRFHHEITRLDTSHMARTMVAILNMAIEIYSRDRHEANPEWFDVQEDVLLELGLGESGLPEFIADVLDRYHHR